MEIKKIKIKSNGLVNEYWTIIIHQIGNRVYALVELVPLNGELFRFSLNKLEEITHTTINRGFNSVDIKEVFPDMPNRPSSIWVGTTYSADENGIALAENYCEVLAGAFLGYMSKETQALHVTENNFTAMAVHNLMDEDPQMLLAQNDGDVALHYIQKTIVLCHGMLKFREYMSGDAYKVFEELITQAYIDRKLYMDSEK